MSELKPCPFCGGEAHATETARYGNRYGVACECGASVRFFDTEAEAIEAWNTRYEPMMDAIPMTEENMRKRGWVKERTCCMTDRGECSECGAYIVRAWTEVHDFNGDMKRIDLRSHNYCPNCGAKVVSE